MTEIPLFKLNPALDRPALAARFALDRRVQIRDFLTPETADTIHDILARQTPWGLAWNVGDKPQGIRNAALRALSPAARQDMMNAIAKAVAGGGYAFNYHHYPMLDAYRDKWAPDGPHDLLFEHINDAPLMDLVREVSGMPDLIKADAQATLYAPGQFLAVHNDSHVAEGWRVAYVMNFARDWHDNWGGQLLFHDDDGNILTGFRPRFNALNLFAVPQRHSVSFVPPFAPIGRFAITGWFRNT